MVYRLFIYRPEYEDLGRPTFLDAALVRNGLARLGATGPNGPRGVYTVAIDRGTAVIRPITEGPGHRIAALTVRVSGGVEPEQDTAQNLAEILANGLGKVRIHDPQTNERFILRPTWWERFVKAWREVGRGFALRSAPATNVFR